MVDYPAPEPINSSSGDLKESFSNLPEKIEIENNNIDSPSDNIVTYKSSCNYLPFLLVLVFYLVGGILIYLGIIQLSNGGTIPFIVGVVFIGLSSYGIIYEKINVTLTIDGNNKLLLIKRTRIGCCLKNRESYNLDDISNVALVMSRGRKCCGNKMHDSFDIIFNLPGRKSINEINKVDKDGEKERVYHTLRRIIPPHIQILGGLE